MVLEELLSSPELLTFILPFLLVFSVFFAVLTMIKLFDKRINIILSLCLTLIAWYGGAFTFIATWLARSIAYFTLVIFSIVFILGGLFWAAGKTKKMYYKHLSPEKKEKLLKRLEKLRKKRKKYMEEYEKAEEQGDTAKMSTYARLIDEIDNEIRKIKIALGPL